MNQTEEVAAVFVFVEESAAVVVGKLVVRLRCCHSQLASHKSLTGDRGNGTLNSEAQSSGAGTTGSSRMFAI